MRELPSTPTKQINLTRISQIVARIANINHQLTSVVRATIKIDNTFRMEIFAL